MYTFLMLWKFPKRKNLGFITVYLPYCKVHCPNTISSIFSQGHMFPEHFVKYQWRWNKGGEGFSTEMLKSICNLIMSCISSGKSEIQDQSELGPTFSIKKTLQKVQVSWFNVQLPSNSTLRLQACQDTDFIFFFNTFWLFYLYGKHNSKYFIYYIWLSKI